MNRCPAPVRLLQPIASLLLLALAALPGHAWGPQGHRVAGALTAVYLQPAAAAAVAGILGDESLADASTWPDRMRGNPAPFWQRTAGAWHYVKVPPEATAYDPAGAPARGDAFTALRAFRAELQDPATPPARRALALRFALHIIQDLHQPLHVGGRDDRGGNAFSVTFDGRRSNLHRVWDSGLLGAAGRSDAGWLRRLRSRHQEALAGPWQSPEPLLWMEESLLLSRSIYPASRRLGDDYLRQHLPAAERRLAQAGARGAAWLNALYEPQAGGDTPAATPAGARPGWWQRLKDFFQEIIE